MFDLTLFNKLLGRRRAITFVAAAALGLSVLLSGAGEAFNHLLRQGRDGVRSHAASGQVEIVEIDAKSLQEIDKWPWPRRQHAAAIDKLREAGARTIAFDVDFSAISNSVDDKALADSLERAGGSVILPTFSQRESSESSHGIDSFPAKPFIDKAFMGAVTVVPDRDGAVRRMPLGIVTLGTPRPSLASMLAETNAEIGRYFDIDYAIDPDTIPRHSFVDLVNGRVPAKDIAGKRILIGATAIEMGDRYVAPGHGVIPGVVIQALGAETLLAGPVPTQLGPWIPFLLALALIACCLRGGSRPLRMAGIATGVLLVLLLPLVTEQLFALSFMITSALTAFGTAGLLGTAFLLGERYRDSVRIDLATGLPNLAALQAVAAQETAAMVVVAHIERFGDIASGLGPEAAARLVSRVADRLSMANEERPVFRIDESSLAWIERKGVDSTLEDRLEAIFAVMRAPVDCGRMVDVSVTIGIAANGGDDVKQLVANASYAALRASRNGTRWELFRDADSDATRWQLSLMSELDGAMTSGQLWNAYQPKLDLANGRIFGVETLVRWLHPERGPIPPDDFIPLVEEHDRARDLTLHVLGRALEDAAAWGAAGLPLDIAVNVSAILLGDSEFIEQVRQMLADASVPTNRITIEVTESAAMRDPDTAIAALESWRALGLKISIDDYGTGQSSLNYLQKLPATELKIDKSFVRDITSDSRNAIMVRSTIALAHELGMKVVAEGIEDEDCLVALKEMGCDTGQGYHIGRPMSAENLAVFLGTGERAAA